MAIFSKEENKTEETKAPTKAKKAGRVKSASTEKSSVGSELAYRFLVEPWITEKSHNVMMQNKYIFKVAPEASKQQVKLAIQKLYNVKVTKMNMVAIPSKKRVFGRTVGRKSGIKKAIVTLKEGDKIELFQGV